MASNSVTTLLSVWLRTTTARMIAPTRAAVGSAMNHQWGRRSRTTSSWSFSSFRGNAIAGKLAVAQFAEALVRQAEVVPDLVDDGDPHRLDHLFFCRAAGKDRQPVDGDPIRHPTPEPVVLTPGERNSLVETEEV